MPTTDLPLKQLIWQIRRLFQRLNCEFNEIGESLGISASQRAILEFLAMQSPQTVPQIAREKSVSRQHIQQLVNELIEKELIETIENPAHKRSAFLQHTTKGASLFKKLSTLENRLLSDAQQHMDTKQLEQTANTLASIQEFLNSTEWQDIKTQ